MSEDRQKIIKAAQKYVSQGKIENAIKEYDKLLAMDPNDEVTHNTVGDLNLSLNRSQTAVTHFKTAAQRYIEEGFYGRALAVYRKVIRAAPNVPEYLEVLADLFVKEGVISDAKKYYAEVAQIYLKSNQFGKTYQIYKKLGEIAQDDAGIHLKLAELSIKLDMPDNARDSYLTAAQIAQKKNNNQQALNAAKMALEIDPGHIGAIKLLFKISVESGEMGLVVRTVERALELDPQNIELLEILSRCCMIQGDIPRAAQTADMVLSQNGTKTSIVIELAENALIHNHFSDALNAIEKLVPIFSGKRESVKLIGFLEELTQKDADNTQALHVLPDLYAQTGDNLHQIATLDRLLETLIAKEAYDKALPLVEKLYAAEPSNERYTNYHAEIFHALYPNDTYMPLSPVNIPNGESTDPGFDLSGAINRSSTPTTSGGESEATIEIELFLSYGMRDKAKAKLKEKIRQDSNDIVFRAKLADILKEDGDLRGAAILMAEIGSIYERQGDTKRANEAMDDARMMDPDQATGVIPSQAGSSSAYSTTQFPFPTSDDYLNLEEEALDLTEDLSDILLGTEEKAEIENSRQTTAPPAAKRRDTTAEAPSPAPVVQHVPTPEYTGPKPAETSEQTTPLRTMKKSPGLPKGQLSMDTDVSIQLEQALKGITDLEFDGNAMELFGEVANVVPERPPVDASKLHEKDAPTVGKVAIHQDMQGVLQEIDFYIRLGFFDDALKELNRLNSQYPDHPEINNRFEKIRSASGSVASTPKAVPVEPAPASVPLSTSVNPVGENEFADLATDEFNIDLFSNLGPSANPIEPGSEAPEPSYTARQIPSVLGETAPPEFGVPQMIETIPDEDNDSISNFQTSSKGLFLSDDAEPSPSSAKSSPDSNISAMHNIFADIVEEANKIFVANEEEGDFDTHYNLGIAYKEMGLIDDAMSSFQKAFNMVKDQPSAPQFIQACNMLCLCFFDKGLYKSAIKWCERGLNSPGHDDHEYMALRYDLANAHECEGNLKKAIDLFGEIYEVDVSYRDVSERITRLRGRI